MELKRTQNNIIDIIFKQNSFTYDKVDGETKNPNIIYDIIYDIDQKLYGVGSIDNKIILLKQENIFYLAPFSLPILDNGNNGDIGPMSKQQIVKCKTGFVKKQEESVKTLEDAYKKEKDTDLIKFKQFCKSQYPDTFTDVNLLNKIDEYESKLERLRNIKDNLINIDNTKINNIEDPMNPN